MLWISGVYLSHSLGPCYQEHDALQFALHDMQHAEKFWDSRFRSEQVGDTWDGGDGTAGRYGLLTSSLFSATMLFDGTRIVSLAFLLQIGFYRCLCNSLPSLRLTLKDYPPAVRHDVDHVIADMNACVVHLAGFLKVLSPSLFPLLSLLSPSLSHFP